MSNLFCLTGEEEQGEQEQREQEQEQEQELETMSFQNVPVSVTLDTGLAECL